MNGVLNVAVLLGEHVIAMEQHGGADADRDAVDGGDDRLDVVRQRIEKFRQHWRPAADRCCWFPLSRKSSRSLPAVNTPEPPVMTMQRIFGLFCAVSMASLIRAIHVLGDRVLLLGPTQRDHAHGVFVGDNEVPGHEGVPEAGGDCAAGESSGYTLHDP